MTEQVDMLNPKEAAEFLRISPATLNKMKARGELKYIKLAGRLFYRRAELLALIERSEKQAPTVGDDDADYDEEFDDVE
jgi:excisionase family DNA binding protein